MAYDFAAIEQRWQRHWEEKGTFRSEVEHDKPKYYVLDMFPYPSGDGLHVGHPEGYTATDIVARYKRMRGFNVLHPMGWDAFGLPAERYAIKTGTDPATRTAECITNFKRQLQRLGFSYDWSREIDTTDPKYFRWTQWIFLKLWGSYYDEDKDCARPIETLGIPADVTAQGERAVAAYRDGFRLAYLQQAPVNWCVDQRVVLANEEVAEYVAAGHEVVRVPMKQWMLRITAYAERLLRDLDLVTWPSSTLDMQRHWIGRSDGAEVTFRIAADSGAEGADPRSGDRNITVFTTRPDTLWGASYLVLAPEHPHVASICAPAQREAMQAYVDQTARRSERERQAAAAEGEKTGVFLGAYAINPVNGEALPIWISDYVIMGYGTGAIMAVPGHDERDHAFALSMKLPIRRVVSSSDVAGDAELEAREDAEILESAFVRPGFACNSGPISGLPTAQAKEKTIELLEADGMGRRRVTYKLRDWLFSRQRYWGEPFPLVHAADGTVQAVPQEELPVTLPELADYSPSETGEPPLANATHWRSYGDGALRETNTMPQWAGSCWYFLRFCDPHATDVPWSKESEAYWMPVDLYVGGAEHAVLHLLYARFWHKVLFDLGYVSTPEPFRRLVHQGMVLGATYLPADRRRDEKGRPVAYTEAEVEPVSAGAEALVHRITREPVIVQWDKMSKSRGNVVNPDDVVKRYGADTMRLYEMFMGPLEHSAPWQPEGVTGVHRFLQRTYRLFFDAADSDDDPAAGPTAGLDPARPLADGHGSARQRRILAKTIAQVTERIEQLSFNTAISSLMVFVRDIVTPQEALARVEAEQFCQLLAPFAPHLAEEIWERALHRSDVLTYAPWPSADPEYLLEDGWTLVVQIKGKKRAELPLGNDVAKDDETAITALALANDEVQRHLAGQPIRRAILVPGKLLNLVT